MPTDPTVDHLLRRVAELEERVAALERGAGSPAEREGGGLTERYGLGDPLEPSAHVRELAASGNLIEAIKTYRAETGAGLKEAKERVEALPRRSG